jgi:GAF domain-containing protein
MAVKGEPIGALVVEDKVQPGAFGQRGENWLSTVARQTAVAIENARLYEQLNRRIDDLNAVNKIGQELTSKIEMKEPAILRAIYEQASQLMNTENMYIALYNEETDTVRFGLAFADDREVNIEEEEDWHPRQGGKGRTEWIIHNQQSILIKTKAESQAWYDKPGRAEYIGEPFASWVGVPMMVGKKRLGVIAAYHKTEEYSYDKDHLQILYSMARQAAIALENARLYDNLEDRVQERTEQLAALQDLGVKITSQLDLDDVLGSIVESANSLLSADFSTLFPYDTEQDIFLDGIKRGKSIDESSTPSNTGFAAKIAKSQESFFIDDVGIVKRTEEIDDPLAFVKETGVSSFAGIPMVFSGKTVGILYVNFLNSHTFTEAEQEIIGLLANQAAVAVENANLYRELEDKIAELERAQNRLVTAERLTIMNQVAAEFVHRLGNIAGTIPVRVMLAKEKVSPDDANDRALLRILDGIRSDVKGLLKAANDLERAPSGDVVLEPANVNQLVHSTITSRGIPPHIKVVEDLSADVSETMLPKDQFRETLKNLITNALDAIPEDQKGTLEVSTNRVKCDTEEFIQLQVSDTGIGIPEKERERIFELFYTTKPQGLGYGLWRDKNLIETLGGEISIDSEVGRGSTFTILLPIER